MRDIVAGFGLAIGGAAYALSAYVSLPLGTPREMGPGLFPFGLGVLLAIMGLGLALQGFFRRHPLPRLGLRSMAGVLGAVAAFAMTIDKFGLFPAIAASTALSALAAPGNPGSRTIVIAGLLMVMAWVIFILILGLPIQPVRWGV